MASSKELEAEIQKLQAEQTVGMEQMDALVREFANVLPAAATQWMKKQVEAQIERAKIINERQSDLAKARARELRNKE